MVIPKIMLKPTPTPVPDRPPLSSDMMAALDHIEAHFPVLDWQVAGISIWPLLRIRWMYVEWARHHTSGDASPATGIGAGKRLRQLLGGAAQARRADRADAASRDTGPARRDLVFLSDGVSFSMLDKRWVERFCDPIIAAATTRGLSSALWTPTHQHRSPRLTPSRFIQPAIDRANLVGALAARVVGGAVHLPAQAEVGRWLLAQGFSAASLAVAKIRSDAWRIRAIARVHERMLRNTQPRLAFVVGYYGVEGMAFVLACRRCGVPVVDIQHGVQGDMHPAYAAWPAMGHGAGHGTAHTLLPDHFWVWSDWERDVIQHWARDQRHAAVVGGNPWMALWHGESNWPGTSDAASAARALREHAHGRPVVLVTLQYGLHAQDQLEPLADLLREAGDRLVFWVRLHPAMLERRAAIRALLGAAGHCELDPPTDLPLPALLACADVHLTHSSSTVMEAAQFGLRSVITTDYGAELFGPLLASGMVELSRGGASQLATTLARLAAAGASQSVCAPPLGAALDQLLAATGPDLRTQADPRTP